MQNNFEPVNLKNANRHLDWIINKLGNVPKPQKQEVSIWKKIFNILAKIF